MSLCLIIDTTSEVPPFAPTTETISPARSVPQIPASKAEIVSVIKSIPCGKAAAEVLQPKLEEAWLSEALPEQWTDDNIVKIPKKGNLKICDNRRRICV